jgi:hypothetical protein
VYTSTGVSTQKYENKQQKNKKNRKKKNFYDTIEERPERASFNHVTAISPGTLRAEMVGGGGGSGRRSSGRDDTIYFFFEQFLFW